MAKDGKTNAITEAYLKMLEEVKKQYQQYVEVSELYELPIQKEEEPVQYQPASPEHPLTTNRIYTARVRQMVEAGLDDSEAGRVLDVKEVRAKFGLSA